MPDVGVLELTIQDNSEKAADGLAKLAKKLGSVKTAAENYDLTSVKDQIKSIVDAVKGSEKTVAALGTLFNAITNFSKAKISKIDTSPIENLRNAFNEKINIGNVGSQMNQLRSALEKDWNIDNAYDLSYSLSVIAAGSKDVEDRNLPEVAANISKVAGALHEYADATNAVRQACGDNTSSVVVGSVGAKEVGSNTGVGIVEGLASTKEMILAEAVEIADAIIETIKQRLEIESPSKKMKRVGRFAGAGLANGLIETKGEVENAAGEIAESITATMYSKITPQDLKGIMDTPLEHLSDIYRTATKSAEDYKNAVGAVLPKVQEISSEQMILAGNAKQATRAISGLIDRLNTTVKPKGFSTIVEAITGISRPIHSAEESAKAFDTQKVEEFNVALVETGDIITSVIIPRFQEMYQIWSLFSSNFDWFRKEGLRLMAGEPLDRSVSPENMLSTWVENYKPDWTYYDPSIIEAIIERLKEMYQIWSMFASEFNWFMKEGMRLTASSILSLGDGTIPGQLRITDGSEPETFLTVWKDTGEQFRTNWVYWTSDVAQVWRALWSPDFIMGAWEDVPERLSHLLLGSGSNSSPLLLGDGGVSPENMLSTAVDTGPQWQPDFIIGEGYVSDAADEIEDTSRAAQDLAGSMRDVRDAAGSDSSYEPAIEFARKWNAGLFSKKSGMSESVKEDVDWIDNLINKSTPIDLLNMKIEALTDKLYEGVTSGKMTGDQIANLVTQIQHAKAEIEELQASAGLSGAWGKLKEGIQKLFPTLTSLLKRFSQIAKYRMLRSVLKNITSGFSEGIKNVYNYSKAVGTDLASSMDSAATSLLTMKNSIGASLAPVISALIPYLQTVVNWFIELVNYANQFFAILNGQSTWTKAVEYQTSAYNDNTKSAKKASDATKDLLADWDELNIIQSSSSSGSGSSKNTEDYSKMFEEVSEFQDDVKDAVSFLEEHLGGLSGVLETLGAIILGWKFSRAFTGVLSTIGKLVAGGALLVLGIELSYGGGFEAGSKGFFDTSDIINVVGGALASGIGGTLLATAAGFSGPVGFAIGVTVGLLATLIGYIQGSADLFDKMKWGDREMSPEEISKYIAGLFSFNVNAEITVLDANIAKRKEAETALTTEINTFTSNLNLAKIKVGMKADDAQTALDDAYASAQGVITEIQNYIDKNHDALATTMEIAPPLDSEGKVITEDYLEKLTFADKTLKEYFIKLGKEIADAIYQGEKDGWTEGEMEAALELMEHQRNVVAKAEELKRDLEFEVNYKTGLKGLTRDNAQDVVKKEQETIDEYREKFMQDRETAKEALITELAYTEAAIADYKEKGLDTTELEKSAAIYQSLIDEYLDPKKAEEAWESKMGVTLGKMRQEWIEALKGLYGLSESDEFKVDYNPFKYHSPSEELTNAIFGISMSEDPVGDATKIMKEFYDEIMRLQPEYIQQMANTFGFNIWDIATDETKKNMVKMLRENLGDDYASAVLQNMQVTQEEIKKLFQTPDTIPEAKNNAKSWWDFLGIMYTPPEEPVEVGPITAIVDGVEVVLTDEDAIKQQVKDQINFALSDNGKMEDYEAYFIIRTYGKDMYEQALKELNYQFDEEGNLILKPITAVVDGVEVVLSDPDAIKEQVKQQILFAMNNDGVMSDYEKKFIIDTYSKDLYDQALKELQYNLDEEGRDMGSLPTALGYRAAGMTYSDVNWSPKQNDEDNDQETEVVINYDQMATSVRTGSAQANESIVSELQSIATRLTQLLSKEWTVNVSPSSGWGYHSEKSKIALDKVKG